MTIWSAYNDVCPTAVAVYPSSRVGKSPWQPAKPTEPRKYCTTQLVLCLEAADLPRGGASHGEGIARDQPVSWRRPCCNCFRPRASAYTSVPWCEPDPATCYIKDLVSSGIPQPKTPNDIHQLMTLGDLVCQDVKRQRAYR